MRKERGNVVMYSAQYNKKGFAIKDFLLKFILVCVFAFLIAWLLPKFLEPAVITNAEEAPVDVSPLTSQIFADNLEKMKEAAISYYTDERLPQAVGESDTMTLSDMIGKKLIVALIDENNKACDVEESYVQITKMENEYLLKVNLKDSVKEDYILVHLGCYTYCDSYICEKQDTPIKQAVSSEPIASVPVKAGVDDTVYVSEGGNSNVNNNCTSGTDCDNDINIDIDIDIDNDNNNNNNNNNNGSTTTPDEELPNPDDDDKEPDTPVEEPDDETEYLYEYQKNQDASFTEWSDWSAWEETSCSTPEYNCNSNDPTCLKKVQRYDRKEQIGTYLKKYEKQRQVLTQTGSYQQKSCANFNYYIISDKTYATTTTTTYKVVQQVITTAGQTSGGGWVYNGRASYDNPPRDTATTQYKFVGANYSYCEETCTTLPEYYYDSYVWKGGSSLSSVTNTTTVPVGSSDSTSSDDSSSLEVTCGNVVTKTVPIYDYITVSEIATRREPLYGTVCYKSTKTRDLIDSGKTMTTWSKYNDEELLNNGWYYTGEKKPVE